MKAFAVEVSSLKQNLVTVNTLRVWIVLAKKAYQDLITRIMSAKY